MTLTEQLLSKLHGNPLEGLRRADKRWSQYKQGIIPYSTVVETSNTALEDIDWDVVICGGTLGVLLGTALVQRGWRIALIERGALRGRDQEWNISRRELEVFLKLGLLSEKELEEAIATEYNPARVTFHKGVELWVEDILNVGIDPVCLLERLKQKFLASGGKLYEYSAFQKCLVHSNGVQVEVSHLKGGDSNVSRLTTRVMVDAMGHFSPIATQARKGKRPDAVCLVVGTCAEGYPKNETGDLFASFTPIQNQCQYFWEAFPARDGRTTYLFTYVDAHPERPSLEELFEEYWSLLPDYQHCVVGEISIHRALFGFFPCYRDSPLQLPWERLLAIGDSSGNQSPLSFGGFGAMLRHLTRLTEGIHEALEIDALDKSSLHLIQPYQPNLSVTWLFQKSMSVRVYQSLHPNQINNVLSGVFDGMNQLGQRTLNPFLQDIVQFLPLTKTLAYTSIQFPFLGISILPQVGLSELLRWTYHYANLGLYSVLVMLGDRLRPLLKVLSPSRQYVWKRRIDAWRYGSGFDYE